MGDVALITDFITWLKDNITNPNPAVNGVKPMWIYPNYPRLETTEHRISVNMYGTVEDGFISETQFDWVDFELIVWIKGGKKYSVDTESLSGMKLLKYVVDDIVTKLRSSAAITTFKTYDVYQIEIIRRTTLPYDDVFNWYRESLIVRLLYVP